MLGEATSSESESISSASGLLRGGIGVLVNGTGLSDHSSPLVPFSKAGSLRPYQDVGLGARPILVGMSWTRGTKRGA